MKQDDLDCPNCGKHYVAYDTVAFRCSNCGNVVNAQAGAKVYSDRIESERRKKLRSKKLAKALVFMIPFVIGMYLHSIGFFSLVLFVAAVVWLIVEIRRQERIRLARMTTVYIFLFLIGTIAGDSLWPPTARCNDSTYSYSEHRSGTCSWHGGVREWNPGPWWASLFH
jgi:DNA-directed RNA polymerase subunit M/transcription elongation factor TFIIS